MRSAPFSCGCHSPDDQSVLLQHAERGVEGGLLHRECVVAEQFHLAGDAVAVKRLLAEHRQHEGGQIALD